jgi:hypothetical protein
LAVHLGGGLRTLPAHLASLEAQSCAGGGGAQSRLNGDF